MHIGSGGREPGERVAAGPKIGDMRASIQRFVRIAIAGLMVVTTSACITSIGPCSSDEAAAVNAVEHYGGAELEPKNDGQGHCGASFTTTDDPDLVIEHYRSTLEAAGWTVDSPQPAPSGEAIDVPRASVSAHKGSMFYGVTGDMPGGQENLFVIRVVKGG